MRPLHSFVPVPIQEGWRGAPEACSISATGQRPH